MYAWGGDTDDWKGSKAYDFGSARARYDKIAVDAGPRSYMARSTPDMALVNPKGKIITSESENPIVIAVDVTGSMATWPGEIFDRLPLLYQTLSKYRPDLEICFAAIGDATCDSYPLQVNDFGKEAELEAKLKALGCEGGGGGHITESYELFGYFIQEHCKTPKAKSPFLLIYGDETFYDKVDRKQVRHYIGDDLQSELESAEVWRNLMQKFNIYFMHKPYGHGNESSTTKEVGENWGKVLGRERIIELPYEVEGEGGIIIPGAQRAVDVGMGLIAKLWGEYTDFSINLDARHDDPMIKESVHKSLRYIDDNPPALSVMSKTGSKKTKSLLD
ncbi:MAG: hypothetical protein ABIH72_05050 [archaeon]